jgi:hypothetical protein
MCSPLIKALTHNERKGTIWNHLIISWRPSYLILKSICLSFFIIFNRQWFIDRIYHTPSPVSSDVQCAEVYGTPHIKAQI